MTEGTKMAEPEAPKTEAKPEAAPPKEAPKVEAKPEADETKALRLEALKAAREAREAKERLAKYEAKEKERALEDARRAKEKEAEDALAEADPHAWVEKRMGMSREELRKRLESGKGTPETALASKLAKVEAQLQADREERAREVEAIKAREDEGRRSNAYRAVMQAAKADTSLAIAVASMSEDPKKAAEFVVRWAETEWPKVAEAEGLDATDPIEAAKACAKSIAAKEVARWEKFRQNPHIAAVLPGAQSQQPPASTGTKPPTTISAPLAGERSTAVPETPRELLPYEQDAENRKKAIRFMHERMASRKEG